MTKRKTAAERWLALDPVLQRFVLFVMTEHLQCLPLRGDVKAMKIAIAALRHVRSRTPNATKGGEEVSYPLDRTLPRSEGFKTIALYIPITWEQQAILTRMYHTGLYGDPAIDIFDAALRREAERIAQLEVATVGAHPIKRMNAAKPLKRKAERK